MAAISGPLPLAELSGGVGSATGLSTDTIIGARIVSALDRLTAVETARWELDRAIAAKVHRLPDTALARADDAMKGVRARFHDEGVSIEMVMH